MSICCKRELVYISSLRTDCWILLCSIYGLVSMGINEYVKQAQKWNFILINPCTLILTPFLNFFRFTKVLPTAGQNPQYFRISFKGIVWSLQTKVVEFRLWIMWDWTLSDCKDIGIRKLSLWQKLHSIYINNFRLPLSEGAHFSCNNHSLKTQL